MTAGSVPSSAALCTLHVHSSKAYEIDVVLRLVIRLAPALQVKVVHHHQDHPAAASTTTSSTKGGAAATTSAAPAPVSGLILQVGPHEHDNLLKHRNSIVRALCGMGLHARMDHHHQLLGGHAVRAFRSSNHQQGNDDNNALVSLSSAGSLSSIVEWMAIAQQELRSDAMPSTDELERLWERCESILETQSYLVPNVPNATVADWDVAVAILSTPEYMEQASKHRHVKRWLRQCRAELVRGGIHDVCKQANVTILSPPLAPTKLPMFYSGLEAATAFAVASSDRTSPSSSSTKDAAAAKAMAATAQPPLPKHGAEPPPKAQNPPKDSTKKDKGAKAAAAPSQAPAPAAAVEFNVGALDIRVGQIVEVWEHETADKLFCELIDLGTEQRKIASGLRPFYSLPDLQNRKVLVLCNLKSRNLVGFPSHGMVLCASNDDHTAVEFVVPPPDAPLGARVVFDGYESGVAEPESKVAKKKIFEAVSPDLRTNDAGHVVWKGALARVQGLEGDGDNSVVKALNSMPNARVS